MASVPIADSSLDITSQAESCFIIAMDSGMSADLTSDVNDLIIEKLLKKTQFIIYSLIRKEKLYC